MKKNKIENKEDGQLEAPWSSLLTTGNLSPSFMYYCENCGRAITLDEYDAFNGRCVGCDEIHIDMLNEFQKE